MKEVFAGIPIQDSSLPFNVNLAGISYCDGTYHIKRQKSDVACIEYIISGTGTVITPDSVFHPNSGDTYFLKPGQNHEYFSSEDDPWVKIWINVSGELVNALTKCYNLNEQTVFCCDTSPYISKIHEVIKSQSESPGALMEKCAIHFHEMMQFLSAHAEKKSSIPEDIQKLKDYIDTNIYSPLSINTLSSLIYKSPSQTISLFKKYYHLTPYEYHLENRIKTATSLLKNTSFSVKEIAYKLNFCDEHYFSSIYKRKTGFKPSEV